MTVAPDYHDDLVAVKFFWVVDSELVKLVCLGRVPLVSGNLCFTYVAPDVSTYKSQRETFSANAD